MSSMAGVASSDAPSTAPSPPQSTVLDLSVLLDKAMVDCPHASPNSTDVVDGLLSYTPADAVLSTGEEAGADWLLSPTEVTSPGDTSAETVATITATAAAATTAATTSATVAVAKAGKGRKAFACDTCRRRKVRCDLRRPCCTNCEKRNAPCVYRSEVSAARHRADSLNAKVSKHSRAVSRGEKRSHPSSTTTAALAHAVGEDCASDTCTSPYLHSVGSASTCSTPLGLASPTFTDMLISVEERSSTALTEPAMRLVSSEPSPITHQPSSLSSASSERQPARSQSDDSVSSQSTSRALVSPYSPPRSPRLNQQQAGNAQNAAVIAATSCPAMYMSMSSSDDPSPELVEHLVALFVTQTNAQVPFFTLGWLQKELASGTMAPALTYAMMAMASRTPCARAAAINAGAIGRCMAARASDMLQRTQGTVSLSWIQAAVLMDVFHTSEGATEMAGRFRRYAQRMISASALDKLDHSHATSNITPHDPNWDLVETQRRVWWISFLVDRFTSIATGQLGGLDGSQCRVPFPCDDVDRDDSILLNGGEASGKTGSTLMTTNGTENTMHGRGLNWRARVIQLAELLMHAVLLANQLRNHSPNINLNTIAHELAQLRIKFGQLGGAAQSMEPYTRLDRSLSRLLAMPADIAAKRTLLAYKILFRVFAHCLHRNLQLVLGRACLELRRLDTATARNYSEEMQLRAEVVQAASEITQLTAHLSDDLVTCINPFHAFSVSTTAFFFGDVANNQDLESWPGIDAASAVHLMEPLLSFLSRLAPMFQSIIPRRDVLYSLWRKGKARLGNAAALTPMPMSPMEATLLPRATPAAEASSHAVPLIASQSAMASGPEMAPAWPPSVAAAAPLAAHAMPDARLGVAASDNVMTPPDLERTKSSSEEQRSQGMVSLYSC
ncbi:hypothetical protein THASP1DRAFT_29891 [Thamnocephalis sphaerospora]|uniref:Zn(2)-C6 fungal-type domain-containing protein n=1 Tax=Thamnocephalis sphaerospora TaxID=78915 RepID=A0A4P9XS01_9FUNG|nr:hypothetical protein THASP1DRAFT_29891 [Thamnocephalis sphaerospora]|eukprot:RKP08301.1 hypothetical protein THASP1DRAFT_29891 [Thamnocephalis sphaerospora]